MTPLSLFLASRYSRAPRNKAQLAALQARGFARLRREIMPLSPFHAAYAEAPLQDWPVMNKARLMEHFTAINTAGLDREQALEVALRAEQSRDFAPMIGDIAVGLSTGTSGQRGLFASNRRERALWAALMLGRFLPDLWSRQRIAFFLRANNQLYESLSNPLIDFRFYDLLAPFEAHLDALAAQSPSVLIAPAQVLRLLAGARQAGALPIRPKKVISVAEVLSPEDAALISTAFQTPVDQVYQSTEGVLGMTCRAGALHLNEGFLHIEREVIDPESGAFHPILTDFSRQTLPILRYRLDDVLVPDDSPCPCGCATLRLRRIEGRADDILYWRGLAGGKRLILSDAIRQAVATTGARVQDYRAVQYGLDRLVLWLDTAEPIRAEAELRRNLAQQAQISLARLPELEIHFGLPAETGRKRRRVTVVPAP